MNKTGTVKTCLFCKKEFYAPLWLTKRDGGKFCSHECYGKNKVGCLPWNTGTKGMVKPNGGSLVHREPVFTGSLSEYKRIHHLIRKMWGKPDICEFCESIKNMEWANKSGEYKLNKNDWIQLCHKCHFVYDKVEERRSKNASIFL